MTNIKEIPYYYSMWQIMLENERAGFHFFSPDTMRFFKSRVSKVIYQGDGGIYFITSEQYDYKSPRHFTVRQFNPETKNIETIGKFNELTSYQAHKLAKEMSRTKGENQDE